MSQVCSVLQYRDFAFARSVALFVVIGTALAFSGCIKPVTRNGPLQNLDAAAGYRFDALGLGEGNTDDVFICLCFSGGGTRAAALAYGVLQKFRDTTVAGHAGSESKRSLLQEVDMISSVSGGSFTAASYALDREHIFDGAFEKKFLKRNVQSRLVQTALRLRNLVQLPNIALDRTDLAAQFYDKDVFGGRTYKDLLDRGDRPYLVINATNVALGRRFEFTQGDFDLLGSDLATLPVGYAVAASAAYPILLSPLRLKYHGGPGCAKAIETMLKGAGTPLEYTRRYQWASSLVPEPGADGSIRCTLDEKDHQYLFLLDGGLSDNLGVAPLLEEVYSGRLRQMVQARRVRHFVVVLVDASTEKPAKIEHRAQCPGLFDTALRSGNMLLYNQTLTMTSFTRFMLRDFSNRTREIYAQCNQALDECCPDRSDTIPLPEELLNTYLVEVNFHKIVDPARRRDALKLPTSLFLSDSAVDDLVAIGRDVVAKDPDFQRLVGNLGGATKPKEIIPPAGG